MTIFTSDLFGTSLAAILTLFVYSYLLRDNPLYRLAEHLLVATGVAYAVVVAVQDVLVPRLLLPLGDPTVDRPDLVIPLVLGVLLLAKAVPSGARLGNPSLGYLVGAGLGLSMGGAIVGILIPQSVATMLPIVPSAGVTLAGALSNVLIVVGTLAVLASFVYLRRSESVEAASEAPRRTPPGYTLGRWFLMIALGAIFGGTTLTYVSLLAGRLDFLINDWLRPLLGL